MDGQEYLNQISASNRTNDQSKGKNFLTSKYFLFGAGAVIALIVIMIIGAVLSSGKSSEKDNSISLMLHVTNTVTTVDEYQQYIKSSDLRSSSSSFSGVLHNTEKDLLPYLESKYNYDAKKVSDKILAKTTSDNEALNNELFEAKINGILDRIFAHKMAYEITMIMAEESQIIKTTKNDGYRDLLNTSYSSLENLYNKFSDFSETK